jgi:hypothetical protein
LKIFRGIHKGAEPSCGGSRAFCGVGGTLPPRLSPGGKRERGFQTSLLPQAHFPAPIADSPCFHSHSSVEPSLRCQLGSSISTGAAISESNCTASFPRLPFHRDLAVTRTRRLGLTQPNLKTVFKPVSLRPLSPSPDCSSAARILRPSPINGAAGSPVFLLPPQSLFSLRSFRRAPTASSPTASDPCPAPGWP